LDVQKYLKAVVALVAAVVAAVATAVGNGSLDDLGGSDWVKIGLVIAASTAAVWWAENGAAAPYIKASLAALTAGLTALSVGYENDGVISQGEVLTAAGALLVALTATYQVRNKTA